MCCVLQGWAQSVMAAAATLPDEQHQEEEQAKVLAFNLLKQAIRFLNTVSESICMPALPLSPHACPPVIMCGRPCCHRQFPGRCMSVGELLRLALSRTFQAPCGMSVSLVAVRLSSDKHAT